MIKNLFLIDGIGAVISALMLGIVLVEFQVFIGLPKKILYILAIIPCFFAVYSFSCFYRFPKNWKRRLKIIAVLNLLYCLLTTFLLINLFDKLTFLGLLYFVLELLIITVLIIFEFRIAGTSIHKKH